MIIADFSVKHIRLPFQSSKLTPPVNPTYSNSIILEIQTKNGKIGLGESCLNPEIDKDIPLKVKSELEKIRSTLKNIDFKSLSDVQEFIQHEVSDQLSQASLCALETALIHAFSEETGQSLADLFQVKMPGQISYIGVIPQEEIALVVPHLQAHTFKKIKLNINRDLANSLENIQTIRTIYGEEVHIQVDMQGSWLTSDALEQIPVLIEQEIFSFEQPFQIDQDLRMGKLQKRYKQVAEFIADESLVRYKDAVRLIKKESCFKFNLKISKLGGVFNTLGIYRLASQYGIKCELGTEPGETGLLRRMRFLLTCLAPNLANIEIGLASLRLSEDICPLPDEIEVLTDQDLLFELLAKKGSLIDKSVVDKYQATSSFIR